SYCTVSTPLRLKIARRVNPSDNMTVILHDNTDRARDTARECEKNIQTAFKGAIEVATMLADSPSAWPSDRSWDDLLVVIYADPNFPDAGNQFVTEFLS